MACLKIRCVVRLNVRDALPLSVQRKMRLLNEPYVPPNGLVLEDSDSHLITLNIICRVF